MHFSTETAFTARAIDLFYLIAYEAQVPGKDVPKIMKLLAEARRTRCLGSTALDLALVSTAL